jgi:hypothetical protein
MRTTADHVGDRPEDREAPGAALVRSSPNDPTNQQAVTTTHAA